MPGQELEVNRRIVFAVVFMTASAGAGSTHASSVTSPPQLPAPTGGVISVSTEAQLQTAVQAVAANGTIMIAPGTYRLTNTLYFNGTYTNVTIRGTTNNRDDVVIVGPGMSNASYGSTPYGIWTGGNVQGITIANLTVREFYYHPIIFNAGTRSPRVFNVHLINAGEQFVKANPDGSGGGVDNGIVEYSVIEYETTAKDSYTNGMSVHTAKNWIVRNNLFRRIQAPGGQLAGPAVLMWNSSQNTLTEGNTFIDCQREIAYGLIDQATFDHSGGIIRNNFIYRSASVAGDTAIGVGDSPNTQVLHNTIVVSGSYPNAIECRFAGSIGVVISNNLTDAAIVARDGASGTVTGNYTKATAAFFVNPAAGDLHLVSTATAAIDKAQLLTSCPADWDGTARPQGAAADIGADEFSSAAQSAPAAPKNVRIIGG
jgi:hypothetical protein